MITLKIDDTGEVFNSMRALAKHFGTTHQNMYSRRLYNSDRADHFYYNDVGITVITQTKDSALLAKQKRMELALKKIVSMEQRICIDPIGEIIDDILAIAKQGLNQPAI